MKVSNSNQINNVKELKKVKSQETQTPNDLPKVKKEDNFISGDKNQTTIPKLGNAPEKIELFDLEKDLHDCPFPLPVPGGMPCQPPVLPKPPSPAPSPSPTPGPSPKPPSPGPAPKPYPPDQDHPIP